jgi:hypothetical protein
MSLDFQSLPWFENIGMQRPNRVAIHPLVPLTMRPSGIIKLINVKKYNQHSIQLIILFYDHPREPSKVLI